MIEGMTPDQIENHEKLNSGTSRTNNEKFDKNGYLIVKNLWEAEELFRPVPEERGQINYWGKKLDQYNFEPLEQQVEGSLSVYTHPQYRHIHSGVRLKLEKIIGKKLYNTYYYDRFYFAGQSLAIHTDRPACEISVSIHISTNLEDCWPIWVKTPDTYNDDKSEVLSKGKDCAVCLNPGDGMIYKGCERPHWRDPLVSRHTGDYFIRKLGDIDDTYYHQVFFHYVIADGNRVQCANDMAKE